jgi:SnoaL-like domain
VVERFVEAWETADVDSIRAMLTEDAVLAMPPWPSWFRGRDVVAEFIALRPLRHDRRWKLVPTWANGQLALASYWSDERRPMEAEGILVLTLGDDGRLSEITAFRDPGLVASFGLPRAMDSDTPPDH